MTYMKLDKVTKDELRRLAVQAGVRIRFEGNVVQVPLGERIYQVNPVQAQSMLEKVVQVRDAALLKLMDPAPEFPMEKGVEND